MRDNTKEWSYPQSRLCDVIAVVCTEDCKLRAVGSNRFQACIVSKAETNRDVKRRQSCQEGHRGKKALLFPVPLECVAFVLLCHLNESQSCQLWIRYRIHTLQFLTPDWIRID
jgi:hypothetical protein